MTIALVTGGAGFIGSHLVRKLIDTGYSVRVLDNFSTGHRQNLKGLEEKFELLEGDVRDRQIADRAVKGVQFVFHEAALASVPRSIKDPISTHEVNATGTLNLLEAARAAKVRRLVYAGSSSAYGNQDAELKSETLATQPLSPYALSKLIGEEYCRLYSQLYGLETVVLRYFNVFGPGQDPDSPYAAAIPRFIDALTHNRRPVIYSDGEQSRDFTYVENVVQANMLAAQAQGASGEVINAGCGDRITVNELVKRIAKLVGSDQKPVYEPARQGDVRHSQADSSKARRLLKFNPLVSFSDGLRQTVQWFQQSKTEGAHILCKPLKI